MEENLLKGINWGSKKTIENLENDEKIARDLIFSRCFHPFGMKQHNVYRIVYLTAHSFAVYFVYLLVTDRIERNIFAIPFLYEYLGGLGITVGCHRYWTHKTFKANKPLQIMLMIMQTIALQFPIFTWSLQHRIHHKYTDTNSDPHNSKRGLIFSHIGWKLLPWHPDYKRRLETFAVPDLVNDPVVILQSKYYWILVLIFRLALPITILCQIYNLRFADAMACNFTYYCFSLHFTFLVNSAAHKWGYKPYDRNVSSVDSPVVSFLAVGEGWHNYHHTFPWDYKAAEFGWKINISTMFIDFFAWLGWAWDLKTVSPKMLEDRKHRTGKGSKLDTMVKKELIPRDSNEDTKCLNKPLWGWDDEDMTLEQKQLTKIIKKNNK